MLTKEEIIQLASKEVQEFLLSNINTNVTQLVLNWKNTLPVSAALLAAQITARKKAEHKLPSYFKQQSIVYPPSLSMEQCSSDETAQYKAQLFPKDCSLIDFTGGFGVDSFHFSKVARELRFVEQQTELCLLAEHNFKQLGCGNIKVINDTLENYYETWKQAPSEVVYLDPARRDNAQKKVFLLEDCTPDVQHWLVPLLAHCQSIWLKLSPLFDIHLLHEQMGEYLQQIHIVSLKNDCKELLVQLVKRPNALTVYAVNLATSQPSFSALYSEKAKVELAPPHKYIYECNASIMKAGLYNHVGVQLGLKKLQLHTHLFTSDELKLDFPGRTFECISQLPIDKKAVHKVIPSKKANISTRNFPLKPEELHKKLNLQSGGDDYLIGATLGDNKKVLLHCKKVPHA